ncbi:hypothetical protein SEVIR_8G185400v4 [Setaria viridis]|uniref:Mannose-6-phosphate isomerase n=1 Tax=Setaria viridis TaxID=4556 RepID=A0A4U6TJZ3_SETVI|nr:mannose-6-phosphate isomerase 1-like [Setaria viridis]TKW01504.1 hypothetical protein SEVIR_8G185400v2 [Setaria viridis]
MASSTASLERRLGLGRRGGGMGLGLLAPADADTNGPPAPPMPGLMRLRCAVQHYDWGRRGADSLVARLAAGEAGPGGADDGRPCAELWMGTHPSAPSSLAPDVSLRDWIARNPAALGRDVAARWGGDLPFLFKVLSVAKALSIQAHPDRALAAALHALRPATYRDANHKPEMAIAVTEFHALCGFTATQELKEVLRTVPEVQELVGKEESRKLLSVKEQDGGIGVRSYLKSAFTKLMIASEEAVSEAIAKLKNRLNVESKVRTLTKKEKLVLSLEKQYPGDVGVLAAFFLNYVKLSPGEALYVGANEPHAYLSGECIECMATSDNVVRAGLTPKYRDVQTLCSMLTYNQTFPEVLQGVPVQPYVTRYTPSTDEFEVDRYLLPRGKSVTMSPVPGPSIFIVMTGEGEIQGGSMPDNAKAKEGDIFFVPAHTEVKLYTSGPRSMQLFRAGVNSRFLS